MILYTGYRKDGWGWETGYYGRHIQPDGSFMHFIQNMGDNRCHEVDPESLGILDTNVKDRDKKVVTASFPYEKGKMSKGGSIIHRKCDGKTGKFVVFFRNGRFCIRTKKKYVLILTWDVTDKVIGNAYSNPALVEKHSIEELSGK